MRSRNLAIFALTTLAMTANAQTVRIQAREIIPITFESSIGSSCRSGDKFFARVSDDRYLPRGTRLEGRVVRINRSRDRRPSSVDLDFDTVILPWGQRERIDAVPVPLNYRDDRYRDDRYRDDRWNSRDRDDRDREKAVVSGALGGLILGSTVKKPFEGAMAGLIAGMIYADSQSSRGGSTYIRSGERMGAYLERTMVFELRDPNIWERNRDRDRYDDRNGDRGDRYGNGSCQVTYRDRDLRFGNDCSPYQQGNTWMLPLDETCRQLGLKSDFDERRGRIYVEDDANYAVCELDSNEYRFNGKNMKFQRNITRKNGVIYVSSELFREMRGNEFRIEHNR